MILKVLLSSFLLPAVLHAEKPNILLICVDDLRPELNCYGVDYIHSPHIDALAQKGRPFKRHYVQAPTCGASRYSLLTGQYPPAAGNHLLFDRAKDIQHPSLPAYFRDHGYTTVAVGKVSHHPGGMRGPNWNDLAIPEMPLSWDRNLLPVGKWQHPRGWMHGLANGEIRKKDRSTMDILQLHDGTDEAYPDGTTVPETLRQLDHLAAENQPFFLATGILRPHLPFGAPKKYMAHYQNAELPPTPHPEKPEGLSTHHRSSEFYAYNRWGKDPNTDPEFALEVRKHYAACVTYADAMIGKITARLKELDLEKNTIVILWGDHGYHLGEHAIWGKHALYEESLRSPMIIVTPEIDAPGKFADQIVETIDLFPTLCDLTSLPKPRFLHGQTLAPLLKKPEATDSIDDFAVSSHRQGRTIRTDQYRLIAHDTGGLELYDHHSPETETKNLATEKGDLAQSLLVKLNETLPPYPKKAKK